MYAAIGGVLAALALAFFGGYIFGYPGAGSDSLAPAKPDRSSTDAPLDPVALAAALDLLEQAYTARFEQRPEDALALVQQARDTDPTVPAVDLVAAEIAFDTRQFADVRKYANRAVEQGQYAGQAHALLGLEKWLTRDSDSLAAASFLQDVSDLFAMASGENYFDSLPRFFYGDTLRESGRHNEGKERSQEALRRLHPWDSSLIIALKSALAADEAGIPPDSADTPATNLRARDAVLGLRDTLTKAAPGAAEKASELRCFLTARQAELLLSDPALAAERAPIPQPPPP